MTEVSEEQGTRSQTRSRSCFIEDARGRSVTQVDPVKLHLLNQHGVIPAATLRAMADRILPGARRQRLLQVASVVAGVVLIVGGNIVYFRYVSTWKGLDPVMGLIYALQVVVILSGPILAYRTAKRTYGQRVTRVMLAYRRCPHCGYDIHALPADPIDGATVCPECGCAWRLADPPAVPDAGR